MAFSNERGEDQMLPCTRGVRGSAMVTAAILACALVGCQAFDRPLGLDKRRRGAPVPNGVAPAMQDPLPPPKEPGVESVANGEALARQGLNEQALVAFERAIAENPKLSVAYLGAADIYREKGDYKTAQSRYESASTLEPGSFKAQYGNGLMLQLLNRLREAIAAYLRALNIQPDDFNANLNIATAYLQLGEAEQAVFHAERAVQINGRSGPARVNLGAIYAAMGRHADAVTEYQQAAELTELTPALLLNLAESLGKTDRFEEMANTIEQLIRVEPSAAAYERLGFAQFKLRHYQDALASYRKSLATDQNYYPALNGVGVCLLNQWIWSKYEDEPTRRDALRVLRRSLELERNQPQILKLVVQYQ